MDEGAWLCDDLDDLGDLDVSANEPVLVPSTGGKSRGRGGKGRAPRVQLLSTRFEELTRELRRLGVYYDDSAEDPTASAAEGLHMQRRGNGTGNTKSTKRRMKHEHETFLASHIKRMEALLQQAEEDNDASLIENRTRKHKGRKADARRRLPQSDREDSEGSKTAIVKSPPDDGANDFN